MSDSRIPHNRRAFECEHCGKRILIPLHLPPTTAPCPQCGTPTTSPSLGSANLPERKKADELPIPQGEVIKLDATQRAETTPDRRLRAAERKGSPSKPVVSRGAHEVDKSKLTKQDEFHQMLIDETSRHRRMMTLSFLFLLLSVAGGLTIYLRYFKQPPLPTQGTIQSTPKPLVIDDSYINGGWEKHARQLLRNYLSANSAYGKLPYTLEGRSALKEMENFHQGVIINDHDTPAESFTPKPLSEADHRRGLFRMSFQSAGSSGNTVPAVGTMTNQVLVYPDEIASQPLSVHAYFLHTADGLKLDWHVFAQTKYRTLLRFACNPSLNQKQMFRVLIVQDHPDDNPPDRYPVRYRIADPANPKDVIRAWADPSYAPTQALTELNWVGIPGRQPVTRSATVELAWIGDIRQRQLVIHRFICWEFLGLGGSRETADKQP